MLFRNKLCYPEETGRGKNNCLFLMNYFFLKIKNQCLHAKTENDCGKSFQLKYLINTTDTASTLSILYWAKQRSFKNSQFIWLIINERLSVHTFVPLSYLASERGIAAPGYHLLPPSSCKAPLVLFIHLISPAV